MKRSAVLFISMLSLVLGQSAPGQQIAGVTAIHPPFASSTELLASPPKQDSDEAPAPPEMKRVSIALFVGPSLPTGDFASTTSQKSGYAKLGLALGADAVFRFAPQVGWMTTFSYSTNSLDAGTALSYYGIGINADSWTAVRVLTGPRFGGPISPEINLNGFVQMGLLIGTIPEIRVSAGSGSAVQYSSTANAFSYGAGVDFGTNRFLVGLRYLGGEPQFNITASGTGGTASTSYTQPMSVFEVIVGVIF